MPNRPKLVHCRFPLILFALVLMFCNQGVSAHSLGADDPSQREAEALGLSELLSLEIEDPASFRLARVSDRVTFALFDSISTRNAVLEGLPEEMLVSHGTALGLSLQVERLQETYESASNLSGQPESFRLALLEVGCLPSQPAGIDGYSAVLVTMVESHEVRSLFDFSMSEELQSVTDRSEKLASGEGETSTEKAQLATFGPDHPTVALFETWRFDELADVVQKGQERELQEARLLQARRAAFSLELIQALYLSNPQFEDSVLDWIENEVDQEDLNQLAQLLQVAGYSRVTPRVLVWQSAPHLFDASVLVAKLYQRFEALSVPVGRKGLRRLDPKQFADAAVLERANVFYSRLFVADAKGRFALELTPETRQFIERLSDEVRQFARPALEGLVGSGFLSAEGI